jgi:hypothetical protein
LRWQHGMGRPCACGRCGGGGELDAGELVRRLLDSWIGYLQCTGSELTVEIVAYCGSSYASN